MYWTVAHVNITHTRIYVQKWDMENKEMDFTWSKWSHTKMYSNKQSPVHQSQASLWGIIEMSLICLSRFRDIGSTLLPWAVAALAMADVLMGLTSPGFLQELPRTLVCPRPYVSVCLYCCWSQTLMCSINFWMNLQNVNSKINEHGLTLSLGTLCLCA